MEDFYCEQVLNNKISVKKVVETDNILSYFHTKPFWPVHIVVIPKKHISSLLTVTSAENDILLELIDVVKQVAAKVTDENGASSILTNLGKYQDSKHLHFHVSYGEPVR